MKKYIFLILIITAFNFPGNCQKLRAYLSYSTFNTPANKPYIETYLSINGNSIKYIKTKDDNYQGTINVQLLFKVGDSIVNYAKYDLTSPIVKDTINNNVNLLDVQRYSLSNGDYDIEITLKDKNSETDALTSYDKFAINFPKDSMVFSGIELLSNYSKTDVTSPIEKNGFNLTPNITNYYPESINTLSFYAELYNSKKVLGDAPFLLTSYIRPFETNKRLDQYFQRKRVDSKVIIPILNSFDITKLPSGNYLLVVEARDRNNKVLTMKELFFQRYNPGSEFSLTNLLTVNAQNTFAGRISNIDTLKRYIDYLVPISTNFERIYIENQVENASLDELQKYFLNFWVERNKLNPEMAWEEYHTLVNQVNVSFKSVAKPGYRTDRGRVYLQYGKPNVMSKQYFEPAAYPYEIWHYYEMGGQRDIKFVFYTHDLVTNDFQLIHSNAVGELNNYRWQTVIYRRTWDPNSIDDAIIPSTWGSKATETYKQPW